KTHLLYRIAEVSIAEPGGTIEGVIFPVVSLKTFKDLVAEYKATGLAYKRRVRLGHASLFCQSLPSPDSSVVRGARISL
ncbi:MAG: hypothetical protein AAFY63_24490, partial [Cyanobacteria bacterium J06643_13]